MTDADFLVTVWADSIEAEPEPESLAAEPSDDAELDIPAWMLAGIAGTESTSPTSGDAASPETDSPELL